MKRSHDAYAYLVRSWRITSSGDIVSEPDTVCFDADLALEMAREESPHAAGTVVYALGFNGDVIDDRPIIRRGLTVPSTSWSARLTG